MARYDALIPVTVITGFLGSGKTTVLARLLRSPRLRDTAVLINEFGEVALDHHLIEHAQESTLLLENGCICCSIRGDLKDSLRDLFSRSERGEIPPFRRVVIETSGLSDPVPIAYTIMAEPVLQHHFRLANIITVVDAVNGAGQLESYPESVKQAAIADRFVITKTDLCAPETAASLHAALARINRAAGVYIAATGELDPEQLLSEDITSADAKRAGIERWLGGHGPGGHDEEAGAAHGPDDGHRHDSGIASFCLWFERALDWTAFGIWMTMLLNRHGEDVLRIKGMLNIAGLADPVLVNGVQHVVHPPTHLDGWPDADRRSRIVFIVRGIARTRIETSLAAFNALADPAAASAAE